MHYKRTFLRRLVPAALVAAPILLMAACASIDCAMTTAVGCRYALRGDTVHDTLTILAVRPGSSDSVLVNRLVQPQAFTVPMSYGADRDQLVFQLTDTLGRRARTRSRSSRPTTPISSRWTALPASSIRSRRSRPPTTPSTPLSLPILT